jgi:hypothetical protein
MKRVSEATKPRRISMSIDQLQLTLIPEPHDWAQPLPPAVGEESIELMARMLLRLVRPEPALGDVKEVRDESR